MKKANWVKKLMKVIKDRRTSKFKWGEFDCVLFACDCVKAMTANDPAKEFRNNYSTKKEALQEIKNYGENLEEAVNTICNEKEYFSVIDNVNFAHRGDLALVETDNGDALGIILEGDVILPATDSGLLRENLNRVKKCWRIK